MLRTLKVQAYQLGYDRPSYSFMTFLNKHYGLAHFVKQSSNFVIFDDYFSPKTEVKRQEREKAARFDPQADILKEAKPKRQLNTPRGINRRQISSRGLDFRSDVLQMRDNLTDYSLRDSDYNSVSTYTRRYRGENDRIALEIEKAKQLRRDIEEGKLNQNGRRRF